MTKLQEFSTQLADAVEKAGQHVARVEARRRLSASGILWADDLIVTAHHIIERGENIRVGLPDGTTVDAELVGRDPGLDLAVLRVATGVSKPAFADTTPRVGEIALALGRPHQDVQASLGIISAVGGKGHPRHEHGKERGEHPRRREGGPGRGGFGGSRGFGPGRGFGGPRGFGPFGMGGMRGENIIRSDLVMYPGFSGGPLVNAGGQVIGMNTSGIGGGASLTIPLSTLSSVVEQLTTHGKIRRGFLGLSVQPMRLTEAIAEVAGQHTGLLIIATDPAGPADNAGLYQGDIIVSLDGEKTRTLDELLGLLSGDRVGETLPISIIRGGQTHNLSITIAERQ